jgi:2-succinyl-5-enolpyruvyl-6-hydroxy-3-cyclohexene-1-carboxylate synthase
MNPSTELSRRLVDELVALGVAEAVLCPGSRNAPLSFALHAADAAGRLRLHVRIDERTAAFLALGLARCSGRPVPVVCTSGTAAANLHPAMLEASHSGVPLLAVTADRPPEMIGTGANQTIVQPGLYGSAARLAVSLESGAELAALRARLRDAVAVSLGHGPDGPGPVHLNVPLAEPLVPDDSPDAPGAPIYAEQAGAVAPVDAEQSGAVAPVDAEQSGAVARMYAEQSGAVAPVDAEQSGAVARMYAEQSDFLPLDPDAPTLVIGGSVPVGVDVPKLPDGLPVIAEPSSPLWPSALRAGPWVLGAANGPPAPKQVVLHGRPTLHRAVTRLLADPSTSVYGVAGSNVAGWPTTVRAVGGLPGLNPPSAWCRRWADADGVAGAALEQALLPVTAPVGLRLAAAVLAALPDGAVLTLGSSNPVRDVALAARPRQGLTVLANRGVAGIDGTVSTAVGAALAHQAAGGGPGYALLGDLTLLHDTTGLVLGPDEPTPDLTIVVLNDVGGGIFSLLEQGAPEFAAGFERVFGTPHRVRLVELCAGLGVGHELITDLDQLPSALAGGGIRVAEVPAARSDLRAAHAALRDTVHRALDNTP